MWLRFSRIDEESSALLVAIGRALAIAQNLENNARFVLRIAQMGKDYSEGRASKLDELIDLANARRRQMLGGMVHSFQEFGEISTEEIEVLRRGTTARNYIAHEATAGFTYDGPRDRAERVSNLAEAVRDLATADNLISGWSYEIQEKNYPPISIRTTYPRDACRWVMEPLGEEWDLEEEPGGAGEGDDG